MSGEPTPSLDLLLAIRGLIPLVSKIGGYMSNKLVEVAQAVLDGQNAIAALCGWYTSVHPLKPNRRFVETGVRQIIQPGQSERRKDVGTPNFRPFSGRT